MHFGAMYYRKSTTVGPMTEDFKLYYNNSNNDNNDNNRRKMENWEKVAVTEREWVRKVGRERGG